MWKLVLAVFVNKEFFLKISHVSHVALYKCFAKLICEENLWIWFVEMVLLSMFSKT